jgi:Uma2 family endonuclease
MSVEEYLAFERSSPVRHEYASGLVFAMAGSSAAHNRLALNLASALVSATRGGPCETYMSDVKLQVAEELFYYPDVFVTCDPRDADPYYKRGATVIVEVLSPSTEAIDRGEKWHNYQHVPSLAAYVLVSQDSRRVEVYRRDGARWIYEELQRDADVLRLSQPAVAVPLSAIYEGWSPPPALGGREVTEAGQG